MLVRVANYLFIYFSSEKLVRSLLWTEIAIHTTEIWISVFISPNLGLKIDFFRVRVPCVQHARAYTGQQRGKRELNLDPSKNSMDAAAGFFKLSSIISCMSLPPAGPIRRIHAIDMVVYSGRCDIHSCLHSSFF